MPFPNMSVPVAQASEADRLTFLRRTLAWAFGGVAVASITSVFSAFAIGMFGSGLLSGWAPMILILGCMAITNYVAQPMVFGGAKVAGFLLGTVAEGVALGFLLLVAVLVSSATIGNPFALIGLAMGMTFFTALGMTAYVYTIRRDFSLIGAGLSALSIPMLILMAVSFAFPGMFGGGFGLAISFLFVGVSAAGLLYQLNRVIHDYRTDMHIEGGYTISIGILVLFWNILNLLMKLSRR